MVFGFWVFRMFPAQIHVELLVPQGRGPQGRLRKPLGKMKIHEFGVGGLVSLTGAPMRIHG